MHTLRDWEAGRITQTGEKVRPGPRGGVTPLEDIAPLLCESGPPRAGHPTEKGAA
jgi:hypothetical protein